MREAYQLELLELFCREYRDELNSIPLRSIADPLQYYIYNGSFDSVDGEVLYCLVRHLKPHRVVEIGSGWSTLLTAQALRKNNGPCYFEAIEPYPNSMVRSGIPGLDLLTTKTVQDVPLNTFTSLCKNDILFIDSSHVAMIGSDVVFELCEILPRLKPGVVVHFHDIFLPNEYKRSQVMHFRMFWNEQYMLQAMLANSSSWEVLWGGAFMHEKHSDKLHAAFRSYDPKNCQAGKFLD